MTRYALTSLSHGRRFRFQLYRRMRWTVKDSQHLGLANVNVLLLEWLSFRWTRRRWRVALSLKTSWLCVYIRTQLEVEAKTNKLISARKCWEQTKGAQSKKEGEEKQKWWTISVIIIWNFLSSALLVFSFVSLVLYFLYFFSGGF